ncbi:hypothetical protein Riean_0449 [Riemerella anatipestifer ATCC 11845 = DSM 15868]|uniref:Uncharacterized protein n=1 Tax=Riemerella anatipestifer (strain ATCC 11845 / DSM 15868 / JCM 9532 / NCTC 11014) TaxID=693978 RepID=E4T9D6_RIEAD|nr:hypothetical protein Riean_0449 [Riemerella anatipestifer ATCC 11845 = DSM 15868]AFD55632.1 hypothetical protein RA0C_0671 [Riemerella anatipestifer ATCC 11845 = DSM 15868]EFT35287.1 hypothetical protein RAYM_05640 [Riemerella anatipestifer RA-YM]SNV54681.1 Uncharacterised protein [Riemerella anatipestifer]
MNSFGEVSIDINISCLGYVILFLVAISLVPVIYQIYRTIRKYLKK